MTFVDRYSSACRQKKGQKDHLSTKLRMLLQHFCISMEAIQDIFCGINAINPHNGLLAQERNYFICCLFTRCTLYHPSFLCHRNRDRVYPDMGMMIFPWYNSLFKIYHNILKRWTYTLNKVSCIKCSLKSYNVVSLNQRAINVIFDISW